MIHTFQQLMDWRLETLLPDLDAGRITSEEFKQTIRHIVRRLKRGHSVHAKLRETTYGHNMRARAERGQ